MNEASMISGSALCGAETSEELEAEGLRDRLRVNDSQISQLEYAIQQLTSKLGPVLRPELSDAKEPSGTEAPQPLRSPAAQHANTQGQRIFNAHRALYALDKRLSL